MPSELPGTEPDVTGQPCEQLVVAVQRFESSERVLHVGARRAPRTPHKWIPPERKARQQIVESSSLFVMSPPSKSVPIPIHRSASHTPSMMVNAKKYLSDRPQLLDCPRCRSHGETELRFVNGFFTYVSFLVILIAGVFVLPLFFLWVPFCVETFKDVEHYCPSCKAWIGTYRRLGKST